MMSNNPNLENVIEAQFHYLQLKKELWFQQQLFSYQWWFLLFLSIIPWFIWWKIMDKSRIHEILSFGMIIAILSSIMDLIGITYQSWFYPIKLHWTFSSPTAPFDISLLPVVFMICYQYGDKWKSFIIGVLLLSSFFTLGEYIFKFLEIYKENTWKSFYSLPIYSANAIFARWVMLRLLLIQKGMNKRA
ncbi:MAG TPA: hypothetical protein DDY49_12740 [Paenibacillaceae bacterium]|nr:hypothetical protein [Paenibacillaceae bacterium]